MPIIKQCINPNCPRAAKYYRHMKRVYMRDSETRKSYTDRDGSTHHCSPRYGFISIGWYCPYCGNFVKDKKILLKE